MEKEKSHTEAYEPGGDTLLQYIKGEIPEEDKLRVDAWLAADEEHERILLQTARIYHACRSAERMAARDSLAAYRKVTARLDRQIRWRRLGKVAWAAACIAGVLGLSTLISYLRVDTRVRNPQWITVQAQTGMRTHFDLPDGTFVYLNAGSTLAYPQPFDAGKREVRLDGEAYFEVTHNGKQPFTVSAAGGRYLVKVLGTTFNVQAYAESPYIATTLVNGSVNLEVNRKNGKTHVQKLFSSQKAIYDVNREELVLKKVNPGDETAWTEGKLIFKDTPLPEVLEKLSHYYNVDFRVQDTAIRSYCITGILDNRLLSQTLDYLRISSGIDYRIEEVTTDDSNRPNRPNVVLWKEKKKNCKPL